MSFFETPKGVVILIGIVLLIAAIIAVPKVEGCNDADLYYCSLDSQQRSEATAGSIIGLVGILTVMGGLLWQSPTNKSGPG